MTRERWLLAATDALRPDFAGVGAPIPERLHVAIGFPSRGARAARKRRLGECWCNTASADGAHQLYLSPVLGPDEVLGVLVHELVHAAVGTACGHKGAFRRVALALGLEGKMTATTVGLKLGERLAEVVTMLGPIPHPALDLGSRRKQTTRMLKLVCGTCGFVARAARTPLDDLGPPYHCNAAMQEA